ncbi:MAG: hypothetical protein K0Q72_1104 [Armatimonadetes bacterium]|nr:hypothetical protein [Armatimonadota bacterium]
MSPMSRKAKAWLIFSGLIPLLGLLSKPPGTALLIYTLFVTACLGRARLAALADRLPGSPTVWLCVAFTVSGMLTETFAWLNNYLEAAKKPALFHPQLLFDLIVGLGFYGGWACAWLLVLRRYRFTLAETFLVTGIQGIFFEQLGAVFIMMLAVLPTNPLQSLLFGLYVCAVHGSAVGLAMAPLLHRFEAPDRSGHWARFPLVMALMVGLAFAGTALVGLLAMPFGGLPPKQSIIEPPFW